MKTKCKCEVCGESFSSDDPKKDTCDLCQPADTWGDDEEHGPDDCE